MIKRRKKKINNKAKEIGKRKEEKSHFKSSGNHCIIEIKGRVLRRRMCLQERD